MAADDCWTLRAALLYEVRTGLCFSQGSVRSSYVHLLLRDLVRDPSQRVLWPSEEACLLSEPRLRVWHAVTQPRALSVSSLEAVFFFSDIYLLMCKCLRLGMHVGVKGQVAGATFPFRLAGPRDHTQVMRFGGKSP